MTGRTHFIGGVTAGVVAVTFLNPTWQMALAGIIVSALAAMVPDRVQYTVKGLNLPLEGHRSASHTLLFAVVVSSVLRQEYALYFMFGLLSHYILDLPSKAGIPLFWPIYRERVAFGWFANGGRGEFITSLSMLALSAIIIARLV